MPSSPPQAPLTRGLTLLFTFNCGFFSWPILLQKVYLGCTLNSRGGPTRQQYERHRKQASLSSEGWPGRYLAQAHTSGWVASRPQEAPSVGTLHTPAPLCPDWTRKDSLKETLRQCRWLPNTPPPKEKTMGWTVLDIHPPSLRSGEGSLRKNQASGKSLELGGLREGAACRPGVLLPIWG